MMSTIYFLIIFLLLCTLSESFSRCQKSALKASEFRLTRKSMDLSMSAEQNNIVKKLVMPFLVSSVLLMSAPLISNAYWNESGEWIELKESSVTEVWGDRLKKASTMKPSDIFMAAKGAGNNDKRVGPESAASKKRRAMAGCRTTEYRSLVPGGITELNCNIKVNKGNSQFMLDILDPPVPAAAVELK